MEISIYTFHCTVYSDALPVHISCRTFLILADMDKYIQTRRQGCLQGSLRVWQLFRSLRPESVLPSPSFALVLPAHCAVKKHADCDPEIYPQNWGWNLPNKSHEPRRRDWNKTLAILPALNLICQPILRIKSIDFRLPRINSQIDIDAGLTGS
jgi:hypothetical protein